VVPVVLPVKIFEIQEEADIEVMATRLKGFREEAPYTLADGGTVSLVTEVLDVAVTGDVLSGVFSKDFIRRREYRREPVESPLTEEAPFWIKPFQKRAFLVVTAPSVARGVKKLLTSHVANQLSGVLFSRPWAIVEVKVSHAVLRELHEANPQATKLIWFDNVDIPGVNKLCLAGSGLADTKLYHDYLDHGTIWYVVFEVQKRGIVVGVTRNCVVTLFSKSTTEDFLTYILDDVLPLIE
jgi:hypothetical protein